MSTALRKLERLPPVAALAVILLATVIYYSPTLNDWFFADDALFLRSSQTTSWTSWIGQAFDFRDPRPIPDLEQYRPMYMLTFRLEYELFGLHAWPYHAVNLAVHLGAVSVLWLIARRLPMPAWGAHLTAAVFALHPTYTEAVAWIVHGNHPMAVFFALLGFLFMMKFTDGGASRLSWLGASALSTALGLLYHPVVLPYVAGMAVWYVLFAQGRGTALDPRRWIALVPFAVIAIPYVLIQRWVRDQSFNERVKYEFGDHMWGIGADYLGLSLHAPPDSRMAPVAIALMALVTILALAPLSGQAFRLGLVAVVWYYAALAPDTVFVFGAFNRLMYAPGAPLAILLAVACVRGVDALNSDRARALPRAARPLAYVAVAAAIVAFAATVAPKDDGLPPNTSTVSHEAALNKQLVERLRREVPTVPPGGTLYIVNPPVFTVHLGLENILRSYVRLYYGEISVEPVPYRSVGYQTEQQAREEMGPNDRIFVFR